MSMTHTDTASAIVAHGPASAGQWKMETVRLRALKEDEVLVRMVASGICLADIHYGDAQRDQAGGNPAIYYPRVLGHEGCGYVEAIGSSVTAVKPTDPVVLSYASCGKCYMCVDKHPAYCTASFELNFMGDKEVYSTQGITSLTIGGLFFGQSSFTSMAIVKECCVVNLRGIIQNRNELKLLAPLGCGVQTGSGAMTKVADVQPGQDVTVIGVGGVGLSAIMAARMRKCKTIIAIDRIESRLQHSLSLGATHIINTSDPSIDIRSEVHKITEGKGVHVSLDTTGVYELARQSYDFVRNYGKVLQVGLARPDDTWDISMVDLMNSGKQILGCVQGDVIPQLYIPKMVSWYKAGIFPIDKIVKFYDARDFEQALRDMRRGITVKPILVWPYSSKEHGPAFSL